MANDVLYCVLFTAAIIGIHAVSLSKHEKTENVLFMKQNVAIESHSRKRRDVSTSVTDTNSTDFHFKHEFLNETKFTLAITWAGENNGKLIVVVTDEEMASVRQPTIYQSVDDGKTFVDISSRVDQALIRKDNGLQVHPFNREKVYLIPWIKDSSMYDMWMSTNGGDTFTKYSLPFRLDGSLVFHSHPSYMDRILAHGGSTQQLWLSVDGGANWKSVASHVTNFKWDDQTTSNDTIFAVVDQEPDSDDFGGSPERFKLTKSVDLGVKWTDVHARVITFGVAGQFLFVTAMKPGNSDERLLEVSQDGGDSWAEVQLPTLTPERFYSILDMAEGVVMIHKDNPGDTGHGTLYISDATGIVFSESLPRHLYPNGILAEDVTDFYRVQSLRGVYITSQMEPDNSIHTMISFNRGGLWSLVKPSPNAACVSGSKSCHLQIHNQYSMLRNMHVPQGPFSTDAAVGVILVHGHVADGLQTTPPDVHVSSDGGYSWNKALDGPHYYQIVDQGGLLVAVSVADDTADTIKYSTDVGLTWDSHKFTSETFVVTGLLTEPGNRAMSVAVWGYTLPNRTWQVHTFNFTALLSRQCEESDYEPWVAHWDSSDELQYKGCLLGRKQTYERLKKNSKCYNGRSKDVTRTVEEKCLCTKDDYDCDYGYYRDDHDSCVLDPQFKGSALEVCDRGHVEQIITEGYHKDPGDVCEGGFSPTGKRITLSEECAEGDKSLVMKDMNIDDKASSHTATSFALVFVAIVAAAVGVVLILFFVGRYRRLQLRQSLHYRLLHSERRARDGTDQSLLDDHSDEESQRTPLRGAGGGAGGHFSSGALRTDDEPLWTQSPTRGKSRNPAESDVEMLE